MKKEEMTLDRLAEMLIQMQQNIEDLKEELKDDQERSTRRIERRLSNMELEVENIRYSGGANSIGFKEAINATAAIGAPSRRLNSAYYR